MMLCAENLELVAGSKVLCTKGNFTVAAGDLWCVLGRNGAGKTTLLRALAGLRAVDGGRVILGERPLAHWTLAELARSRAFMAQQTRDSFAASVLEIVLAAAYAQRGARRLGTWFDGPDETGRALALLAELGLAAFARRDVRTLSGGERQRVGLAAALMQDSELLLLDEPLAHLDIDMQLAVLADLRRRMAGAGRLKAVVLSLHDINLAARFATHVLLFDVAGALLGGPAAEVLSEAHLSRVYQHPVRALDAGQHRLFVAQ